MGADFNSIFGYGFILYNFDYKEGIDSDSEEYDENELYDLDDIEQFCKENYLDYIHDCYNLSYDIFIGINKHRVQNGNNIITKNDWIDLTIGYQIQIKYLSKFQKKKNQT